MHHAAVSKERTNRHKIQWQKSKRPTIKVSANHASYHSHYNSLKQKPPLMSVKTMTNSTKNV